MKTVVLLTITLFIVPLASCQTATNAQTRAASIKENFHAATQTALPCVAKVAANPAYASIAKHAPLTGNVNPTLMQLADDSMVSDEDIRAVVAFHAEMEPCRAEIVQGFTKAIPRFIPTLLELYHASDLVTVDLIQRKITWGELNKRKQVIRDRIKSSLQAFLSNLDRELAVSHQAELAQRQAASQAFWEAEERMSKALGAAAYAIAPNSPGGRMGAASAGIPLPPPEPVQRSIHCTMVPDGNGNMTGNCQ